MTYSRFNYRCCRVVTALFVLCIAVVISGCFHPFQSNNNQTQSIVLDFEFPVLGSMVRDVDQAARYLVPSVSRVELVLIGEGHDFHQTTVAALQRNEDSTVGQLRLNGVPVDRSYTVETTVFANDLAVYYASASGVLVTVRKAAQISMLLNPHEGILETIIPEAVALEANNLVIAADGFRFIPIKIDSAGTYSLNLEHTGSPGLEGVFFVAEDKFISGNRPGLDDGITVTAVDLENGGYRIIICLYNPGTEDAELSWNLLADWQLDPEETSGVSIDLSNPDDIIIWNGEEIILDQSGISGNSSMSVSATEGYLSYFWSLNGIELHEALEIDPTIPHVVLVDSLSLDVGGVYELLLEVEITENDWRSAILFFEVIATDLPQ